MEFNQGIYIDGIFFDIPFISAKRNADFLDKYFQRTEDGDAKRELIGVYYNYIWKFGMDIEQKVYKKLWDKLTEPVEFHDFVVPDLGGKYTFRGYVSNVSDEMLKVLSDGVKFGSLSCKMISKEPSRRPS